MSRAFYKGSELTDTDLVITFRDENGALFDPYSVTYGILDPDGVLIDNINTRPAEKKSLGKWYAPYIIEDDAKEGDYKIQWNIQELSTSSVRQYVNQFNVLGDCTISKLNYPDSVSSLIHKLRIRLGDNDPDRNYRFAPPKSPNEVNNFTTNHGYIWQDYELLSFLEDATDTINWYLRGTNYTIGSIPAPLRPIALMGAMVHAIDQLSLIWIQDEFGYSLNGISLDLSKSEKYRSMVDGLAERFETKMDNLQANRSHKIKGLRQARFSVGYGYGQGQYSFRGAGAGSWRRSNRV